MNSRRLILTASRCLTAQAKDIQYGPPATTTTTALVAEVVAGGRRDISRRAIQQEI